jgi:hypothetical protein
MKIPGSRNFPFNKYITSHWETMCSSILLLTPIVFFREIHVFLQVNSIGLLETNRAYLHLETFKFQELLLSKTNSVLTGSSVSDAQRVNADGFLSRDPCVPPTLLHTHTSNKISLCTPWDTYGAEVFPSKRNQFSLGNNLLVFQLLTYMVFSAGIYVFLQLWWIGLFGRRKPISTLRNLTCKKYCFQRDSQFSQGNNVLDAAASNIDGFFGVTHVFLQLSWTAQYGTNTACIHLEKPK